MKRRNGRIPFLIYVLVRWLRTLPVILACLMMIYACPNTSSGPLFGLQLRNFTDNCNKCGWADVTGFSNKMRASEIVSWRYMLYILYILYIYVYNIKYIHTWYRFHKLELPFQCLPHAWYLSADFQLYVMSYFLVLLLFRKSMLGIKVSVFIIFGSMVVHGVSLKGPIIGFPGEIDMR